MATAAKATDAWAGLEGTVPYRLTVPQFLKMVDAGVFSDDAHVELLGGLLVNKMVKKNAHNFAVRWLGERVRALLPRGYFVSEEKSYLHGRYDRPEPDLAAEVADTSYAKDRGAKWWRYASAAIPVYIIVNLKKAQVEVCSNPSGRGEAAVYRTVVVYEAGGEFPVVVDGRELGRIAVSDLLT